MTSPLVKPDSGKNTLSTFEMVSSRPSTSMLFSFLATGVLLAPRERCSNSVYAVSAPHAQDSVPVVDVHLESARVVQAQRLVVMFALGRSHLFERWQIRGL